MQNNPQMQAISQAFNVWQSISPDQREEHIKNLYRSQNRNYTEEKAKIIDAIRNNDPRINQIMGMFQRLGLK